MKPSLRYSALAAALLALPALSEARPLGIDVSSYQGSGVNWTSVKNSGITFAWTKATEGTSYTDPTYSGNVAHAKAAGVYIGGYHFAQPASGSPTAEAAHFWAVSGGNVTADGKSLSPMLDMETFTGITGASTYSDWANKFCTVIMNNATANGVKTKPAIYTSACSCQFDSSVSKWLSDIANYSGASSQTGSPWSACASCDAWGSGVWTAWQYTDCAGVGGVSGCVDGDVFNGTSAQLVSTMVATSVNPNLHNLRADFNNDGRDDYVFFRPSNSTWHVNFSSALGDHTFQWGAAGDIPLLCGDFSGDGSADAVVFRPSDGTWHIRYSQDASSHAFSFGQNGDIPILGGDFDNDGVPDATVFRPSNNTWYVRFSSTAGIHTFVYGTAGDIPLMNGDFDGDGDPDAVVFRPGDGTWHVRFSSDASSHAFQFGQSGDIPLLGDFDKDGVPDATVFRPSTGVWYVRLSSDASERTFQFGQNGDKPWSSYVTADHSVDQSLYRPATGTFYVRDGVTGNFTGTVLGTSTDIPVH
jgi:GH25 family lysozyme M1 (1,4-beta-N-acetylmuramidase)